MNVMIKKALWIGLALLLGFVSVAAARADEWNKKTVLTFSQPVEIPGHVLPAGTYTFQLAGSTVDRHIVQVFSADGSKLLATVMTIADHRLKATDQTVITFGEVPRGAPEVIRAWFYPGNTIGQEFVYLKPRAMELAKVTKMVVPAVVADAADDVEALETAPIVAMTPDEEEMPVTTAIQTAPTGTAANAAAGLTSRLTTVSTSGISDRSQDARGDRQLPQTASFLTMTVLLGLGFIGLGCGLMLFRKRRTVPIL